MDNLLCLLMAAGFLAAIVATPKGVAAMDRLLWLDLFLGICVPFVVVYLLSVNQ